MQSLEIATFPLSGQRLIEASAGTGKTYTIAGLYLRLLLEKGLTVRQILVVTFTEAATQELRGRIRKRIYEALQYIEEKKSDDDFAQMLDRWRGNREAAQQLRDAVTRMDEAAVFTIHGFCQRTLTDCAFESGVLFDAEFVTDESEIREQIANDFWRMHVSGDNESQAQWVLQHWETPMALFDAVRPLVDNPQIRVFPDIDAARCEILKSEAEALFKILIERWHERKDDIVRQLSDSPLLSRSQKAFRMDRLEQLFAEMSELADGGMFPTTLPTNFELFTAGKINDHALHKASVAKKGIEPPRDAFFDMADELLQLFNRMQKGREVIFMRKAAAYMKEELARRKEKGRVMFFDDLLGKLDDALEGTEREALAARIRAQYPVAMIDEFQDTDPTQYRIFRRIYHGSPECGLFMIGDPKQAIYSFRGADIFTYMQARHDTDAASGHFTLDTNYRSHSALVSAVNSLFGRARAPFVYEGEIDFQPVKAAGMADERPLTIRGETPFPLVCWHEPLSEDSRGEKEKMIPKSRAMPLIAHGCAAEITRLLNLGQRGEATIGDRNLAARDIAVLVRNRYEAAEIRSALQERGVASVYISRDSVFDTDEARDLAHLLRAVAEPASATLLRTALATRLLGYTAEEIHILNNDEIRWEEKVQAFQWYHGIWSRYGFMPMFHNLLRREGVIARLLSCEDGERRMTNLLQLAELAQLASAHHVGIESLLHWLVSARNDADGSAEEQQLRMESDEELVQIVTIHKSKGLEYGVVFIPFIWSSRQASSDTAVLKYHDEETRTLCADLGSEERKEAERLAEKERLAEDLRLLYVALTRAKYRCYFSWGMFNGAANSAMAYLLHQHADAETGSVICNIAELDDAAILHDLEQLNANGETCVSIQALPQSNEMFSLRAEQDGQPKARVFTGNTRQSWQVSSFSGLTLGSGHALEQQVELPDHDQVAEQRNEEREEVQVVSLTPSPFTFPRGTRAGLFLHYLFENISFADTGEERLSNLITQAMGHYGIDEKWLPVVLKWVASILDTPLDEKGALCLRNIPDHKRMVELEFQFPVEGLNARALNGVLGASRGSQRQSASLDFATVTGMMKGFVDLIFEHEGRFYVLDYKSNHLGYRYEEYQREQLTRVIDSHYYDLQYLIYTLALHRYLRSRRPDYDYEQHFGGVYYLFLRGMCPQNGHRTGVYADRPSLALLESLEQCFSMKGEEVECA